MAFVDAIELASDSGAADAIGAMAGDLAKVAPAIENSFSGAGNVLRSVGSDVKPEVPAATLPTLFDPFPGNAIATAAVIAGVVFGGFALAEAGFGGIMIISILGGVLFLLTKVTKK